MTVQERVERVGSLSIRTVSPVAPRGAIVMVHGVCTSGRIWTNWAQSMAQRGLEVSSVDLRGHGQSDGAEELGRCRVEDYVADVERVLDHTGAQAVVGHDMGGLIGQVVASRREMRALVLVGTVAPKGIVGRSSLALLWRELRPRYIRALLRGKSWRPARADLLHTCCEKLPVEQHDEVLSWVGPESGIAAREMILSGVGVEENAIRCPVLVVASTFDRLPPARQRLVASCYHADYVEFAQHSHLPMLEPGWERPAAVIGRWLEEAARLGDMGRNSGGRISAGRLQARRPPASEK